MAVTVIQRNVDLYELLRIIESSFRSASYSTHLQSYKFTEKNNDNARMSTIEPLVWMSGPGEVKNPYLLFSIVLHFLRV